MFVDAPGAHRASVGRAPCCAHLEGGDDVVGSRSILWRPGPVCKWAGHCAGDVSSSFRDLAASVVLANVMVGNASIVATLGHPCVTGAR